MPDYVELRGQLWNAAEDEIIVGCTNFALAGRSCPAFVALDSELTEDLGKNYPDQFIKNPWWVSAKGRFYKFVSIEAMRDGMGSNFCSVLRYKRTAQLASSDLYILSN